MKVKNIARVRNCPDVAILNSLFGLRLLSFVFLSFIFLSLLSCCLVVFLHFCILSFCLFVFLSFCLFTLWSNVLSKGSQVSSGSHWLTHSLTHSLTKVRYRAARAAKNNLWKLFLHKIADVGDMLEIGLCHNFVFNIFFILLPSFILKPLRLLTFYMSLPATKMMIRLSSLFYFYQLLFRNLYICWVYLPQRWWSGCPFSPLQSYSPARSSRLFPWKQSEWFPELSLFCLDQSVTFVLVSIQTNIRIHLYNKNDTNMIEMIIHDENDSNIQIFVTL